MLRFRFILLLCFAVLVQQAIAQQPVRITLHADQQAYLSGELIWVDGIVQQQQSISRIMHIQLLDRTGTAVSESGLQLQDGKFNGWLAIPKGVRSDYYFLDAYVKGGSGVTNTTAVMVINPAKPPGSCTAAALPQPEQQKKQSLDLSLSIPSTGTRGKLNSTIQLPAGITQAACYISRYDRLEEMTDSVNALYPLSFTHADLQVPELEGHTVTVKATDKDNDRPMAGIRLTLAVLGGQSAISNSSTDEKGMASFILPLLNGDQTLICFAEDSVRAKTQIRFSGEAGTVPPIAFPCLSLPETLRAAIESRMQEVRAAQWYQTASWLTLTQEDKDTTDFYGEPYKRYRFDDYVRYPNMEELIIEFIHEARVKKSGEEDMQIRIMDLPGNTYFKEHGLVMLDGIPLPAASMNALMKLDPLLLESVDLIPQRYIIGYSTYQGLMHYKSYKKDGAGFTWPAGYWIQPFHGIQENTIPTYMERTDAGSTTADLSPRLWRETDLKPDAQGRLQLQFTTNDLPGTYRIKIIASTAAGNEQAGTVLFQVTPSGN